MGSLAASLMSHDMDVPCPRCGYPVWLLWSELAARVTLRCPCCRVRVRLDDGGTAQVTAHQVQSAIDDLGSTLRRLFS